jgi:hypothetical protein
MSMRHYAQILPRSLVAVLMLAGSLSLPLNAQSTRSRPKEENTKKAEGGITSSKTIESEMRGPIERYVADRGSLTRSYPVSFSSARRERSKQFYAEWLSSLQQLDFDPLSQDGKVDYLLFKNHLEDELRQLEIQARQQAEIEPLIPFAKSIADLEEARRRMEPINSAKVATLLTDLKKQVDERRRAVELGLRPEGRGGEAAGGIEPVRVKKTVGNRAVGAVNGLRATLRNWYAFYNGYDPVFTWWNEEPYKALEQTLTSYASFLTERVVGIRSDAAQAPTANRGPGGGAGGGPGGGQGGGPGGGQGFQRQGGTVARPGDTSDIVGDPIGGADERTPLRDDSIHAGRIDRNRRKGDGLV